VATGSWLRAGRARRKRLKDLLEVPPSGVCLVPVTDDVPALGCGIVDYGKERRFRMIRFRAGMIMHAFMYFSSLQMDGNRYPVARMLFASLGPSFSDLRTITNAV
jgi:hypothetical protein